MYLHIIQCSEMGLGFLIAVVVSHHVLSFLGMTSGLGYQKRLPGCCYGSAAAIHDLYIMTAHEGSL